MRLARFVVSAVGVWAVLAVAGCSGGDAAHAMEEHAITHQVTAADVAATKSTAPISGRSATLWVNGMGCPLCASNIDRQLERVKGVSTVKVDLGSGFVELGLAETGPHPSPAVLGEAVEDAGFTLVKVVTP